MRRRSRPEVRAYRAGKARLAAELERRKAELRAAHAQLAEQRRTEKSRHADLMTSGLRALGLM